MVFTYTDKQLNELNQGKNVYSSNPEYAKRKGYKIVTPSPKNKGETNNIISDGQEFRVVATKSDPVTGFDVWCSICDNWLDFLYSTVIYL